jgi:hypothetical protein
MWAKMMVSAVAVLAAALFAFLGDRMINAYGAARYEAGLAQGQARQLPGILAANAAASRAGLDARDRLIAAEHNHANEIARLAALLQQSENEGKAYDASDAGRAACLDVERVRAIEASRLALFAAAASATTEASAAGSMSAHAVGERD